MARRKVTAAVAVLVTDGALPGEVGWIRFWQRLGQPVPAIADAVRETSRLVIAHEDQLTCGFGAELAARAASDLFEFLDAPVRRVAALDTPVAYCPELEEVILPQSSDVLNAIRETARY